ncbi:MAG: substrate-binding domain-containing protein [Rhodospirillales bacterium]
MLRKLTAAAVLAAALAPAMADAADKPIIGLITKTNTNPFFVKMREGAKAQAEKRGAELRTFAGSYDGDLEKQIEAVESLIVAKAKGILITPTDSRALVPVLKKARDAGILVIALDTPLEPITAADATFATDNFKAGELIGQWAKAKMGAMAKDANIALLDLNEQQISVDVLRNQGFLKGFGVDLADPNKNGDENDSRIIGNDSTMGSEEGGRKAMENLMQRNPNVNLVYTINEPAAAGAYEALRSVGLQDKVLIVSVDGGCPGVKNIAEGVIGATSMQFPLLMASMGVDAVVKYAKTGVKPQNTPGLDFFNTGVELVTDEAVSGVPSISSKQGMAKCWG